MSVPLQILISRLLRTYLYGLGRLPNKTDLRERVHSTFVASSFSTAFNCSWWFRCFSPHHSSQLSEWLMLLQLLQPSRMQRLIHSVMVRVLSRRWHSWRVRTTERILPRRPLLPTSGRHIPNLDKLVSVTELQTLCYILNTSTYFSLEVKFLPECVEEHSYFCKNILMCHTCHITLIASYLRKTLNTPTADFV